MAVPSIRPASFAQKRLWFLSQLDPGLSAYNLPRAIRITGRLDIEALEKTLDAIVERHESLRTTFEAFDGEPAQVVHSVGSRFQIPVVDLEDTAEDGREGCALAIAAEEAQRPFDLTVGPLLRTRIVRFSQHDHLLILVLHHIVADGWSMGVLFDEIGELYDAFFSGRAPKLPNLSVQYSDFARWQQECFQNETLDREVQFWKRALAGVPELLHLPSDRQRSPVQSHKGHQHSFRLDCALAERLKLLGTRSRVTPFMTLLAAFQTLLWRYSGADEFVVGTPVAGRSEIEFESLIGLFANTLPLHADLTGDPTFRELLERVRSSTLEAFEHLDAPLDKLVEQLHPERNLSYTPLFQVMFVLQNMPRRSLQLCGTQLEEIEFDHGCAKFDLTLEVIEDGDLHCTWDYSTDLFDHERIVRMANHFETLLRGIADNPDRKLSKLPILTSAERKRILTDWNTTDTDYPRETCIHEAFEKRAEQSGDQIAVFCEERNITLAELNYEANALAHYLGKQGLQPGSRVGVFVERSIDAIVALLAVMKAGASYVPIDPDYPKERIAFMLEDSKAATVITQFSFRRRLPEYCGAILYLDRERYEILSESRLNPKISVCSVDPAYVIYTSGSTGAPKGVVATHRASMNRLAWMWEAYPFEAGEICAQRTSLSFVDSVWEIFGPLLQGVPLSIVPDRTAQDPEQLGFYLATREITRIVLVPAVLEPMLESCRELQISLPHLRICVSSGEALPYALYKRFDAVLPHVRLINLYGSSEVAADVTSFDTRKTKPSDVIPIGRPIANVRVYILDRHLNPVPVGIPGEIYIGGECLAAGYLDRPELTAERFVMIPFGNGTPERLYRTGDLGRYRLDGNVEFLGRTDRQIKVRGVRIELGEIEALLASHPSIRQAVVCAANGDTRNHNLVAYVTPAEGQTVIASGLRSYLKAKLPEPMMPSAFLALERVPLTPNGKVDLHALPQPDSFRSDPQKTYIAPRNATEESLAAIWSELLGVGRVGVDDNFFELGGHSLMAVRVVARIRKSLHTEVALRSLFEEPTLGGLAVAVEKARANGTGSRTPISIYHHDALPNRKQLPSRLRETSIDPSSSLVELQPRGLRPPLFLFPGSGGDPMTYAALPPLLDSDQPVYGLQSPGLDGRRKPLEQIEEMAEHFLGAIRKLQPVGPYQLAGFCFGGIVAFEVAQLLMARAKEVSLLALIETWPPRCVPVYPATMPGFASLARSVPRGLGAAAKLPPRQAFQYIRQKLAAAKETVLHRDLNSSRPSAACGELVMRANHRAAARYGPSRYPGRIVLFIPTEDLEVYRDDPRLEWGALAEKGYEVIRITGNRGNLLSGSHVQVLANNLMEQLDKLHSPAARVG